MLLHATNINTHYERIPILNAIDLQITAGELVGVLEHNGINKTTLLRTLMGFMPAQREHITFDEADITREPPYVRAQHGLNYMPQNRKIFPNLSIHNNLRINFAKRDTEEHI